MRGKVSLVLSVAVLAAGTAQAALNGGPANYDAFFQKPAVVATPAAARLAAKSGQAPRLKSALQDLPKRRGYPSQTDAKLGGATFLWSEPRVAAELAFPLKRGLMAESQARNYLREQAPQLVLARSQVGDASLTELHDTGRGPVIARFQQMHEGVEVFGRRMSVMMDARLNPVATSGYFAADVRGGAKAARVAQANTIEELSPEQALSRAIADLGGRIAPQALQLQDERHGYQRYRAAPGSLGKLVLRSLPRIKRVWYPGTRQLLRAWYLEVDAAEFDSRAPRGYAYVISASDGETLFRKNLVSHQTYSYRVYADPNGIHQPDDSPFGNARTMPLPSLDPNAANPRIPDMTRLVTLESGPIASGDPWLPPGASETVGNNVDAYVDLDGFAFPDDADDGYTPGGGSDFRAPVSSANSFDYEYLPDSDPATTSQRNAAIVNLFYLNNWLHDWWYGNGFDEAAGNAQANNYGRGGRDGDPLLAEAQDASGRNNANMFTPRDGVSPRMQMFLYSGPELLSLTQSAPVAATYPLISSASFGPQIYDLNGDLVLFEDGIASPDENDACEPASNAAALAGKIALIHRGTCLFPVKVQHAQDAGAIGVLVINNPGTTGTFTVGDSSDTITIPMQMVTHFDGQILRGLLDGGVVSLRMQSRAGIDRDGSMDNAIVAHEWGHYLSGRLVSVAGGLLNLQGESMGEGWGDFSALMMMLREEDRTAPGNDRYQGAYPAGSSYVHEDAYSGIRRAPYSTDFAVFPMTFKHIELGVPLPDTAPLLFGEDGSSNGEPHAAGEIWCNVLWEIYAALLNDPRYSFSEAQNRMKDYVVAGLKMTPDLPTFLEARNALLAAALATDPSDFELMAGAFAKRGMGIKAVAPEREDPLNAGIIESYVPLGAYYEVTNVGLRYDYEDGVQAYCDTDAVLDQGETLELSLTVRGGGTEAILAPFTARLSGRGFSFPYGDLITFMPLALGAEAVGTIAVHLYSAGTAATRTLEIGFPDADSAGNTVIEPDGRTLDLVVNFDIRPARGSDDIETPSLSESDWSRESDVDAANGWRVADYDGDFGTGLSWVAPDLDGASDLRLVTPELAVSAGSDFTLSFDHYFHFEPFGIEDGTLYGYDGGVVEISVNGRPYEDVFDFGAAATRGTPYNGRVLAFDPDNTGRPGFADSNGGLESMTLNFGDLVAGQHVRLRFRLVSDIFTGDFGWLIDNVSFSGIDNLPFHSIVAEDGVCADRPLHADAGADFSAPERNKPNGPQAVIRLNGRARDPDGLGGVGYAWTQVAGPTVQLLGADTAKARFKAPEIGKNEALVFRLTVNNGTDAASDQVTVTLTDVMAQQGGGATDPRLLLLLLLVAGVECRRRGAAR